MTDQTAPTPPAIPFVNADGTINPNGVDLGQLDGWVNSNDPSVGRDGIWSDDDQDQDDETAE